MDSSCGAPGVEGRAGVRIVAHHLVELPMPGGYVIRLDAPVEFHGRLELRNCEREGMASVFYQPRFVYKYDTPADLVFMDLPAGVYVVRLMVEETSEPLMIDASVEPWP